MAIRVTTMTPMFGMTPGYINTDGDVTRDQNMLKNPPTQIIYTPLVPPITGQAWPRGNMC